MHDYVIYTDVYKEYIYLILFDSFRKENKSLQ